MVVANRDYDALQLAIQYQPDMVVYDVATTPLKGKSILDLALPEASNRIPLLLLTNADPHERPDAPSLLKPFTMGDLFQKIEQIRSRYRERQTINRLEQANCGVPHPAISGG